MANTKTLTRAEAHDRAAALQRQLTSINSELAELDRNTPNHLKREAPHRTARKELEDRADEVAKELVEAIQARDEAARRESDEATERFLEALKKRNARQKELAPKCDELLAELRPLFHELAELEAELFRAAGPARVRLIPPQDKWQRALISVALETVAALGPDARRFTWTPIKGYDTFESLIAANHEGYRKRFENGS